MCAVRGDLYDPGKPKLSRTPAINQAAQLAAFVCRSGWDDLSAAGVDALKRSILDALGCAIGALGEPPVRGVRATVDELGGAPISTLIGGGRTAPDRAALHNGAAVRYLDYSDTFFGAREGGHPSDNLAPVLAAAEHADRSGAEFLTALAVAYQVYCRLIESAPVRHRGFDHTTLGVYAVAAGAAKALALDEERVANAIRIAGTAFNALRVTRTGRLSNWKGLAYSSAAASGIQAAYLAGHRIAGPELVFEGAKGFMDAIAGEFHIDWDVEDLEMVRRVMIKQFNAEGHSQTALEALATLRAEHGFTGDDVERVDIDVFDACYRIIGGGEEGDKHDVRTKEDADHSMPYLAAVLLLDGQVEPAQYAPGRITAPDVQDLLRRVHIHEDPTLTARFPEEMPSRVQVQLASGECLKREQSDFAGYPTRPLSWDRVADKCRSLAERHADPRIVDEIVVVVRQLEQLDRIRELTALLASVAQPR